MTKFGNFIGFFQGEWRNDKKHGNGIQRDHKTGIYYLAYYEDNKLIGRIEMEDFYLMEEVDR